jgi:predicted ester cyclase
MSDGPIQEGARLQGDPEAIVREFVAEVRSGRNPDAAHRYLAPKVIAHQVTAEGDQAIERTPPDYADHVREFLALFGNFELEIEELLVDGPKVYVRWKQSGIHLRSLAGEEPTGKPLIERTSVVYRVERGLVAEYWLQTDRKGLELQIERESTA